jgi:hypothetical protein
MGNAPGPSLCLVVMAHNIWELKLCLSMMLMLVICWWITMQVDICLSIHFFVVVRNVYQVLPMNQILCMLSLEDIVYMT